MLFFFKTNPPPAHPTPKQKQKQKQKQIQSNFFSQANTNKGTIFFSTPFTFFFSIFFQNKGVTTGPLKFLCTQPHKNTLYPSTPYDIFVNIGSFPKSRLSQSKNFPFHPFKANQIKYSSTSCCRKLLFTFYLAKLRVRSPFTSLGRGCSGNLTILAYTRPRTRA